MQHVAQNIKEDMIVHLQHDFLKNLRQQQQAEDDEYSDDEVCTVKLDMTISLLTCHLRVTMSFPRCDVSQPKAPFEGYWVRNIIGGADLPWRLRGCLKKCTIGTKLPTNTSSTTKRPLLKICLLYTSPSPRDGLLSRMPSSA